MSVRLQTKWLWVWIALLSLTLRISCLLRARSSLTFRQTIECGFTLKLARDMITNSGTEIFTFLERAIKWFVWRKGCIDLKEIWQKMCLKWIWSCSFHRWIVLGKGFWLVNIWRALVWKQLKWLTSDFTDTFLTECWTKLYPRFF